MLHKYSCVLTAISIRIGLLSSIHKMSQQSWKNYCTLRSADRTSRIFSCLSSFPPGKWFSDFFCPWS